MEKHISISISGKVQGVFFRASTKEKADALGVLGTVKNEADGSVFIEAEGEEEAINQFVGWCKKGPPRAIVTEIKIEEAKPKHFHTFEIVR
jgi:acylphosphatase